MAWLSSNSRQPFIERLRSARSAIKPSAPWTEALRKVRGQIGRDGVYRIATDAVFDALNLPPFQRTPEPGKRIKTIMLELGWTPVRTRHVTSRGRAARVRGYPGASNDHFPSDGSTWKRQWRAFAESYRPPTGGWLVCPCSAGFTQ